MDLGSRGLADLGKLYEGICEAKNIRGNDSEEQKKRLEKKRGMKLDDHPQFKKEEVEVTEKKKDDTYLEPDMKKRQANNEKARKELAKGPQMKNPHFEETQMEGVRDTDPEKGTAERKARLEKKRGMKVDDHPQYKKDGKPMFSKEELDRIEAIVNSWED